MPFYVYILYSKSHDRYYIGQTDNVDERVIRHNKGYEKSSSPFIPWNIKCIIKKQTRGEAMILEKKLKNLNREELTASIKKYGAHIS